MDSDFSSRRMRIVALLLLLFSSNQVFSAENGIFNYPNCVFRIGLIRRDNSRKFEEQADRLGIPKGKLREEYIERQIRLKYLASSAKSARIKYEIVKDIVTAFERLLKESPEDRDVLWTRAKKEIAQQRYGNMIATDEDANEALGLPDFITYPRNSRQFLVFRTLAALQSDLAQYRAELSAALVTLPLNTELSKANEAALAKAIMPVEEKWSKRRRMPPEIFNLKGGISAGLNKRVAAKLVLANNEVPPELRREIEKHLDFLDKYSLSANDLFADLVALSGIYPLFVKGSH